MIFILFIKNNNKAIPVFAKYYFITSIDIIR